MKQKGIKNIEQSIHARLLSYAKRNNLDFNFVLQRYGIERLLYRMSISAHGNEFILKGASLFLIWKGQAFRVTKDADFLCNGIHEELELEKYFKGLCEIPGSEEDGLLFKEDSVKVQTIREEQIYGGIRVTLLAMLQNARIPLQIDIGYGDAVTPSPEHIYFPAILGHQSPHLRAYTRYSVVAEKFNAMVELGLANSRLKDYYDIWLMSEIFEFEMIKLRKAIVDTFKRRKTDIPSSWPKGGSWTENS